MSNKILTIGIILLFGAPCFAQKAQQFEFIADSRKPKVVEWGLRNEQSVLYPNRPSTWAIAYCRLREKPKFRYGFRYEIGYGAYYSRYSFSRDISSGPVHYQIDRLVRSYFAEIGYKLEWRLNTPKASDIIKKGTYVQIHSGLGLFQFSAPGYIDKQGEKTLVEIREENLMFPHAHLFLGLSHRFQFTAAGPIFYALGGVDGFLGAENGYYTQLNYRLGLGVHLGK